MSKGGVSVRVPCATRASQLQEREQGDSGWDESGKTHRDPVMEEPVTGLGVEDVKVVKLTLSRNYHSRKWQKTYRVKIQCCSTREELTRKTTEVCPNLSSVHLPHSWSHSP